MGQMKLVGMPGSENGGAPYLYTHQPDGMPHWLGTSEREIFCKIAFVDYGYFYDLDNIWYYVIPGPFRIKIPLAYIGEHLDESDYEFDERDRISRRLAEYILGDCYASDPSLQAVVRKEYPQGIEAIREDVLSASERDDPCVRLWERYKAIYERLDDWVVVNVSEDLSEITGFLVRGNQSKRKAKRVETIEWERSREEKNKKENVEHRKNRGSEDKDDAGLQRYD